MSMVSIFVAAVLLAFAVDLIPVPRQRPVPWQRSPVALSLHVLCVLFWFALVMLVSERPVFSVFCALGWLALQGVVSNAKFKTMREPFVFTDMSMLAQSLRYPRLYLPWLGIKTIAEVTVAIAALVLWCWAEPSAGPHARWLSLLAMAASVALGSWLAARLPITLDPETDQRRHGFLATLTAYQLNGLRPSAMRAFRAVTDAGPFGAANDVSADASPANDQRPDVIVIQSESYFDARRISAAVNPAAYAQFDRACRESVTWGELTVPAWGANTMRSEFSFLTGLASSALGYARFFPYAYVRRACASLPGWFKRRGYRTLAIHPYHADFFGRNRVFRWLHFDRFQDITHFQHARREGPYVSDAAVADAILAALDEGAGEPNFIFAITMENHGPLHLETVQPGEDRPYHTLGGDENFQNFTVYLRHVSNMDAMIGSLTQRLRLRARPVILCLYGDHVPPMFSQFGALGVIPTQSAYFVWRSFGEQLAERRDRRVETLGAVVLGALHEGK